jgi:hypothetical protein
MAATCDQCGAPVEYGQPTDTTYRAFYHLNTGRAACGPTAATAAGDGPVNA